jgi:hypothetical protein
MARNYPKEHRWEDTPTQVKRREARNKARRKAIKDGTVKKGDGKQLDHVGYHRTGSLADVPVKVTSAHANLSRQPPTKARGKARNRDGT